MAICTESKNGVCVVCGSRMYSRVIQKCKKRENPISLSLEQISVESEEIINRKKVFRLKEWTETQLKKIGVNPEKNEEVIGLFGFAPTCGCGKGREWKNKIKSWLVKVNQNGV